MNHSTITNGANACREHARFLDAYLDGVLEPGQLLDVEGHVASCGACRERVELDRATRASLKRTVKAAAPEGLRRGAFWGCWAARVKCR